MSTAKFKVGDKVRIVDTDNPRKNGVVVLIMCVTLLPVGYEFRNVAKNTGIAN